MTLKHSQSTYNSGIHSIDAGVVASSSSFSTFTAFPNKSTFDSSDVGKIILDQSTGDRYVMTNHSPARFVKLFDVSSSARSTALGALSDNVQSVIFNNTLIGQRLTVSPDIWGADPNGVNDSSSAFNSCFSFALGHNFGIRVKAGTYKILSPLSPITASGAHIYGEGQWKTIIQFDPAVSGTLFQFGSSATHPTTLTSCGVEAMTITCGNTTIDRTAVKVRDVSEFLLRDVSINFSPGHGQSTNNVGFHYQGRDHARVKNVTIGADLPIWLDKNPNYNGAILDCDDFIGTDWYLTGVATSGSSGSLVHVSDGWVCGNVKIAGVQSWVGNDYGFFWEDTIAPAASQPVVLDLGRYEGGTSDSGYAVYVNKHGTQGGAIVVKNLRQDPFAFNKQGGIFARGVMCAFENIQYVGLGDAINIDRTCQVVFIQSSNLSMLGGNGVKTNSSMIEALGVDDVTLPSGDLGKFTILVPDSLTGSCKLSLFGKKVGPVTSGIPSSSVGTDSELRFSSLSSGPFAYQKVGGLWYPLEGVFFEGNVNWTPGNVSGSGATGLPINSIPCNTGDFVDFCITPAPPGFLVPTLQITSQNHMQLNVYNVSNTLVNWSGSVNVNVRVRPHV